MANQEHLEILKSGFENWNKWRGENKTTRPNLFEADLRGANLQFADLSEVDLERAYLRDANFRAVDLRKAALQRANLQGANCMLSDLRGANFREADLEGANLQSADLREAHLVRANLKKVNLFGANLQGANLIEADFSQAILVRANLQGAKFRRTYFQMANLRGANLKKANLEGLNLEGADLEAADLEAANLQGANLEEAKLIKTNLSKAILFGCSIYGTSVWDVNVDRTDQRGLVITQYGQPVITVDNIKVAQFVYLLMNNAEIRDVINTITGKAVLLLGRFGDGGKPRLDAMANYLRSTNLLPIIMDFEQPDNKDFTETVRTLAGLCKYVIADLTHPQSVPHEIAHIAPFVEIPIVPLIKKGVHEYSMFRDMSRKYHWLLPLVEYEDENELVAFMGERIIEPAEKKHQVIEAGKKALWP